jgi:hypothetical protein
MTIMPDGKVGIGTSAPVELLQVNSSTTTSTISLTTSSTGATSSDGLRIVMSSTSGFINVAENLPLTFRTNNTDRQTITNDGLVGINETLPTAQLHVKSGATTRVPLIVDTLSGHTGDLQNWRVNTSTVAGVYSNGRFFSNVGIGAVSGSSALIEFGTGTTISRNVADTNPALIVNLANASATGNIQVWQKSGVAKATITNGGGATFSSFVDLEERLSIDVTNSVQNEAILISNSTDDLFFVDRTDGDVYNLNGTYGTISDVRLKENIVQARDYTEDLMKLNVVKYSFKKDHSETPTHLGFIAQEVEEVFPGLVETRKSKELDDQKQIKMSVLIPMLVKTIQEQEKRIKELEARL